MGHFGLICYTSQQLVISLNSFLPSSEYREAPSDLGSPAFPSIRAYQGPGRLNYEVDMLSRQGMSHSSQVTFIYKQVSKQLYSDK